MAKILVLAMMLLGLPLAGVALWGLPLEQYLEFPPRTRYVSHAPFSWIAFACYGLIFLAAAAPLVFKGVRAWKQSRERAARPYPFPWWGWLGVVTGLLSWGLAWTRFTWFSDFQPHTFTPLWLSFILVVNALAFRRKGRSMMLDRPGYFLLLFPVSAAFWWFFEYLNRFIQNWYYVGVHFDPWAYFWYATLSFSTVLPAVLGTREWLSGFSWLERGFKDLPPFAFSRPKSSAWAVLLLSAAGLAAIGLWPDLLFPLLWVSPLLIIVSLQTLTGEKTVLSGIGSGDWRLAVSSALAALLCGGFWEMWNYGSLAKWEYALPFVHQYRIFEMPLLGYAGYLPFGLECAVIGAMLERIGPWMKNDE
ncbi:MAG: hypothetical protein GY849_10030 [Deltaproteobacteria bacterium]|nr:hypothetical protein [Deltaproteobacteria bacterium]